MKKKTLSRLLACVLTGVMMAGTLAGCGSTDANKTTSEESKTSVATSESTPATSESVVEEIKVTYPLEEKVKLTMAILEEGVLIKNAENIGETPFGKAWQEATGVELEIMQIASNDAMNLLFASGELPDIIYYNMASYNGGYEKAIKDKVVEPLNDLMDYAPDYQAVLDSNPEWRKAITTSQGDVVGFPFIRGEQYLQVSRGLIIRDDWMTELNLEMPETPDDLYNVLKTFKEKKGVEYPLSVQSSRFAEFFTKGIITSPFGLVTTDFYQVDGKVHWGYTEPEYKDVLAYMNKLYKEGLLDPNFQTIDSATAKANILNGATGVTYGAVGGNIGTYLSTMEATDPTYSVTGFGPLVAKAGDTPMYTYYENAIAGNMAVITPQCENKEAAAKFLNYAYTEEGYLLFNFGIEGESYTMENGVPTYTELITKNPNGWTMQEAMAQYMRSWQNGPFVQDRGYMEQYSARPQQKVALDNWTDADVAKYAYPSTTIPEDLASECSKLSADATTYINEMRSKFVTGEESLDNFDKYLATLKDDFKIDRIIEIKQLALDEYNSR